MPYEWRTRPGLARSRAFNAIPLPLTLALIIFFIAGWRATSYDSVRAGTTSPSAPSTVAPPITPSPQIDTSSEISGLRQEVADLDTVAQQQTLISMADNDKIQSLQSELTQAQKKSLAATDERDDALREIKEMREGIQSDARRLGAVCSALRAAIDSAPQHRAPAAALALCHAAAPK